MKRKKKRFPERLGGITTALILTAAMVFSATPAFALNTGGQTDDLNSSITVHKYKTQAESDESGTGTTADAARLPVGAEPLSGIGFVLYRLDTTKVEGGASGIAAVSKAPTQLEVSAFLATYKDPAAAPSLQTTDVNGEITWSNLSFGYYLLIEGSTGGANVDMAVPSIVTLPYASEAVGGTTTYTKDVHVYPKNVSREEAEKTIIQERDIVKPGQDVQYQIAFKVPVPSEVYADTTHYLKGNVIDILPKNPSGQPMLTIKTDYTIIALSKNGVEATLNSNVMQYSDTSSSDGRVTWTFNLALAQAINTINTAAAGDAEAQVAKVLIRINATVNNNAFNGSVDANGVPMLVNAAQVSTIDAAGNIVISAKSCTAHALPTVGFQFTKVNSANQPITTDTATFKLASTYDNAAAGTYIKNATTTADLEASTLSATGKAVFSGLNFDNLTVGAVHYAAIEQAVTAAQANLGVAQSVDLWLVETKAPNGYRMLQAPQKITLKIVKATPDAKVTTSVQGAPLSLVNAHNGEEGGGNFSLPNTGGIGALVFGVVGGALVVVAVVYFVRSRKRDKTQQ